MKKEEIPAAEDEAPEAPLAPSEEGAVEDGVPSETEGEITPPAEGEKTESGCAAAEGEKTESGCAAAEDGESAPAAKTAKPKQTILRRITGIVGYAVIGALIIIIGFVFLSNMKGKVTFIFGKTMMWVRTESMEPTIPARSYILVEKVTAGEIEVGDVIVFRSDDPTLNGAYNTHRVEDILGANEEFVTKGDNNPGRDSYTAKADKIVGRYIRNMPVMTAFGRFMSKSTGILITFTVIFGIFLIIYVPDMIRASKRREEEAARIEKARMDALVALEIEKLKAADAAKKAEGLPCARGGGAGDEIADDGGVVQDNAQPDAENEKE
ncbi:MAG: signal peptidase I [Clostridia bacterium]|nr:signal peptidase I [Clostridia bacterium]